MYKYKGLYSIAFIILAFINSTFALYKDQTGVIDWYINLYFVKNAFLIIIITTYSL